MKDLQSVLQDITQISKSIQKVLISSTFEEYDDLSGLDIDYKDPDQQLLLEELQGIISELAEVTMRIDYLNLPIKEVGLLKRNRSGHYAALGQEYTAGSLIEAFLQNGFYETPCWSISHLEHDGERYYIVEHHDTVLEGLRVRLRLRPGVWSMAKKNGKITVITEYKTNDEKLRKLEYTERMARVISSNEKKIG